MSPARRGRKRAFRRIQRRGDRCRRSKAAAEDAAEKDAAEKGSKVPATRYTRTVQGLFVPAGGVDGSRARVGADFSPRQADPGRKGVWFLLAVLLPRNRLSSPFPQECGCAATGKLVQLCGYDKAPRSADRGARGPDGREALSFPPEDREAGSAPFWLRDAKPWISRGPEPLITTIFMATARRGRSQITDTKGGFRQQRNPVLDVRITVRVHRKLASGAAENDCLLRLPRDPKLRTARTNTAVSGQEPRGQPRAGRQNPVSGIPFEVS